MSKKFWNKEYTSPKHLQMSHEAAEDLLDFMKWSEKGAEWPVFPEGGMAVDVGCGNGRNLIHVCREGHMRGYGVDFSEAAIIQARAASTDLSIDWRVGSMAEPLPLENESVDCVLDMMASHVLLQKDREHLLQEILRVLKPYGWIFFKSFLLEEDLNARELLKNSPGPEAGTYIHPEIGIPEYVWTEEALREFFEPHFVIHRIKKSHKHMRRGEAYKRRTIVAYMEKREEQ